LRLLDIGSIFYTQSITINSSLFKLSLKEWLGNVLGCQLSLIKEFLMENINDSFGSIMSILFSFASEFDPDMSRWVLLNKDLVNLVFLTAQVKSLPLDLNEEIRIFTEINFIWIKHVRNKNTRRGVAVVFCIDLIFCHTGSLSWEQVGKVVWAD
jgi:hypothetical protein